MSHPSAKGLVGPGENLRAVGPPDQEPVWFEGVARYGFSRLTVSLLFSSPRRCRRAFILYLGYAKYKKTSEIGQECCW